MSEFKGPEEAAANEVSSPPVTDEAFMNMLDGLGQILPREWGISTYPSLDTIKRYVEQKNTRIKELEYKAYHDPLTGVYNRGGFYGALNMLLPTLEEDDSIMVSFVDLDNFKEVNDTHGHHLGDNLLVRVASRLGDLIGEKDILGRYGGDEFIILHVLGAEDKGTAENIPEQLESKVSDITPVTIRQSRIASSTAGTDIDLLIIDADLRVNKAKKPHRTAVRKKAI